MSTGRQAGRCQEHLHHDCADAVAGEATLAILPLYWPCCLARSFLEVSTRCSRAKTSSLSSLSWSIVSLSTNLSLGVHCTSIMNFGAACQEVVPHLSSSASSSSMSARLSLSSISAQMSYPPGRGAAAKKRSLSAQALLYIAVEPRVWTPLQTH